MEQNVPVTHPQSVWWLILRFLQIHGDVPGPGGGGRADLFFLHQIAALIVGIAVVIDAGELLLIAAHMLAHHLVEVVVLVGILFALGGTALLQQIAQRIVGVGISEGIVGIDLQPAGAAGEPVQRIIGKGRAALEIFRSVAVPLELRQHIALGVVGILLDPAVGIGQLDGTVGINV